MSGSDGSGGPSRYCPTPHQMPVPAASPPPQAPSPMLHSGHGMSHGHHMHGAHPAPPQSPMGGYYNYNPQPYYPGYYGMQQQPVQQHYGGQQPQWSAHVHQPNAGYYQSAHQSHPGYGTHGTPQPASHVHQGYGTPTPTQTSRAMHGHLHNPPQQPIHHPQPTRPQPTIPPPHQQHMLPHAMPSSDGLNNALNYEMNAPPRPASVQPGLPSVHTNQQLGTAPTGSEPPTPHALMNLSMFVNQNAKPSVNSGEASKLSAPVPSTNTFDNSQHYGGSTETHSPSAMSGRSGAVPSLSAAPVSTPQPYVAPTTTTPIPEQSPQVSSTNHAVRQPSESPQSIVGDSSPYGSSNGGHGMMPVRLQNMGKGARTKANMRKMMQEQHEKSVPGNSAPESDAVEDEEPPKKKAKRKYKERAKPEKEKSPKEKTPKGKVVSDTMGNEKVTKKGRPRKTQEVRSELVDEPPTTPKKKGKEKVSKAKATRDKSNESSSMKSPTRRSVSVSKVVADEEAESEEVEPSEVTPKRSLRRSVSRSPAQASVPVASTSPTSKKKKPSVVVKGKAGKGNAKGKVSQTPKKRGRRSKKEPEEGQANDSNNVEEEIAFALLDLKTGKGSPEKRTRDRSESLDITSVTSKSKAGKAKQRGKAKVNELEAQSPPNVEVDTAAKKRGRKPKEVPVVQDSVTEAPMESPQKAKRGRPPKSKSPEKVEPIASPKASSKTSTKAKASTPTTSPTKATTSKELNEAPAMVQHLATASIVSDSPAVAHTRVTSPSEEMDFPVIHIPEVASGAPLMVEATIKDKTKFDSTKFVYEGTNADISMIHLDDVLSPPPHPVEVKEIEATPSSQHASKKKKKSLETSVETGDAAPAEAPKKRKYVRKKKVDADASTGALEPVSESKIVSETNKKAKALKTTEADGEPVKSKRKYTTKKMKLEQAMKEAMTSQSVNASTANITEMSSTVANSASLLDVVEVPGTSRSTEQKINKNTKAKKSQKSTDGERVSQSKSVNLEAVPTHVSTTVPPAIAENDDSETELPDIDSPMFSPAFIRHSTPLTAVQSISRRPAPDTNAGSKKTKTKKMKKESAKDSQSNEIELPSSGVTKSAKRKYTKKSKLPADSSLGTSGPDDVLAPVTHTEKKQRKRKSDIKLETTIESVIMDDPTSCASAGQSDTSVTAEKGSEQDLEDYGLPSLTSHKKKKSAKSDPAALKSTPKKIGRPKKNQKQLDKISVEANEQSRASSSLSPTTKRDRSPKKLGKEPAAEGFSTPKKKSKVDTKTQSAASPSFSSLEVRSSPDVTPNQTTPKKKLGRPRKNSLTPSADATPSDSAGMEKLLLSPTAASSPSTLTSPGGLSDLGSPASTNDLVESNADDTQSHKPRKRLVGVAREQAEARELETIMEVSRAIDAPLPPLEFFYQFEYSMRSNYPPSTPKAKKLAALQDTENSAQIGPMDAISEGHSEIMQSELSLSPKPIPKVAKNAKATSKSKPTTLLSEAVVSIEQLSPGKRKSKSPPKTVDKKRKSKKENPDADSTITNGSLAHLTFIPALAKPIPAPTIVVPASSISRKNTNSVSEMNETDSLATQTDRRESKKKNKKNKQSEKQPAPTLKVIDGIVKFFRGSDEEDITTTYTSSKGKRSNDMYDPNVPWQCCFCHFPPHHQRLGDLFGPYYTNPDLDKLEEVTEGVSFAARAQKSGMMEYCLQAKLKNKKETWFHEDCALWAGGVIPIGYSIRGLDQAVYDASRTTCTICKKAGATIGCIIRGCRQAAHFPCARRLQWTLDEDTFHSFCEKHRKH